MFLAFFFFLFFSPFSFRWEEFTEFGLSENKEHTSFRWAVPPVLVWQLLGKYYMSQAWLDGKEDLRGNTAKDWGQKEGRGRHVEGPRESTLPSCICTYGAAPAPSCGCRWNFGGRRHSFPYSFKERTNWPKLSKGSEKPREGHHPTILFHLKSEGILGLSVMNASGIMFAIQVTDFVFSSF